MGSIPVRVTMKKSAQDKFLGAFFMFSPIILLF